MMRSHKPHGSATIQLQKSSPEARLAVIGIT